MKIKVILLILIVVMFSCNNDTFQVNNNGIEYKFIVENKDSVKIKIDDIVYMNLRYTTENDSVLFDSKEQSSNFKMKIKHSSYDGSIDEALAMMHYGDSAVFKVNAMDFYVFSRGFKTKPDFIQPDDKLIFYVKIKQKMDLSSFVKEKQHFSNTKAQEEEDMLNDYIRNQNIITDHDPSGIYYIEEKKGKGDYPVKGDTVVVNYIGKFVSGEIFDTSYDKAKPLIFTFGTKTLIKGLELGIAKMKKGGKAKIIIPSKLAYGAQGLGPIPPYSTLIFEIEILDIRH